MLISTPKAQQRRLVIVLLPLLLTLAFASYLYLSFPTSVARLRTALSPLLSPVPPPHYIDELISTGKANFAHLRSKETKNVAQAAAAYRARRGRHPPPAFDGWVRFARENKAIVIEDMFDQIYHDIAPLWALDPADMRVQSARWPRTIRIRNGAATQQTDQQRMWMDEWHDMISGIASRLPDVDLAMNEMDETRLLVPWETIDDYMTTASTRATNMTITRNWTTKFPSLPDSDDSLPAYDHPWSNEPPFWRHVNAACPPWTPGRNASPPADITTPPVFPDAWPTDSHHGFVRNWTTAQDACVHGHLFGLHGTFIEPVSISTSATLMPMLSHSKLSANNEILIPAPVYWGNDPFYSGGEKFTPWEHKTDTVMWRGTASGGRNHEANWRHFHRHRFVSTLNGTSVALALLAQAQAQESPESVPLPPPPPPPPPNNFPAPSSSLYPLPSNSSAEIGDWLNGLVDAGFTHLECFPGTGGPQCPYTEPFFAVRPGMPMSEQYRSRYLPDVDGNSYSGRWRAFLRSRSVPLKATIYRA